MDRFSEKHLRAACPVMDELISRHGPCTHQLPTLKAPYQALARAIVYQQISGKAAASIFKRFCALFPGRFPNARKVASAEVEYLRSAGLSNAKAKAIIDLATKYIDGTIADTDQLLQMPDEQIIEQLTAVWGVGRWTAEMYLMFTLGRPDVLPLNDIGLFNGARSAFQLNKRPDALNFAKLAKPWRPFRTVACWYLWREADLADLPDHSLDGP